MSSNETSYGVTDSQGRSFTLSVEGSDWIAVSGDYGGGVGLISVGIPIKEFDRLVAFWLWWQQFRDTFLDSQPS